MGTTPTYMDKSTFTHIPHVCTFKYPGGDDKYLNIAYSSFSFSKRIPR